MDSIAADIPATAISSLGARHVQALVLTATSSYLCPEDLETRLSCGGGAMSFQVRAECCEIDGEVTFQSCRTTATLR